jgi:hypothetical protein
MAQPSARDVARDPDWLPHTYDAGGESLTFVQVPRLARQDLMFLSEEHFQGRFAKASFPPSSIEPEMEQAEQAPLHFIFHTSFCGSTLLTRALTIPGVAEALKEPDVLINLANRLAHSDDAGNRQRLELVLKLLERAPAPGEVVIVKPTNFANRLIEPLLELRPEARAVLLWSDLDTFLRSLVKRGMWGRRFGRQMYLQFAGWVPVNFGLGPAEMFELTDLQVAGLAWLLQIAHFSAVAEAAAPDRLLIVEAADVMTHPAKVLYSVQNLFGLDLDAGTVDQIASGPVFSTHSKFADQEYGVTQRDRDHEAVDQAHGEEIRMVAQWIGAVAAQLGLPLQPNL